MSSLSDTGNSDESISDLNENLSCSKMGNSKSTKNHVYFNDDKLIDDIWDNKHVKLPCSNANDDNYV
jgi:predicted lipoprotein